LPDSKEKIEGIGYTNVKELELKIEQMDIVASPELRKDTKDEKVKSEDTANKQETINKATKHCDVELVASENKSEEMHLPPKIGSPIKESGVALSTIVGSQITSQAISEDLTKNKSNNQGDVVISEESNTK
jgi:hypothetical protein